MTPTGLSYATMHRLRTFGSYTALVSSFLAPASGLAAGRTCTLGESQQVKSGLGKRLFGIALGAGASSALLSWSVATDAVQLQPLGKDGKAKDRAKGLGLPAARPHAYLLPFAGEPLSGEGALGGLRLQAVPSYGLQLGTTF